MEQKRILKISSEAHFCVVVLKCDIMEQVYVDTVGTRSTHSIRLACGFQNS